MWIWRTLKFSETKPIRQVDLGANNIWTKKDTTTSNISYPRLIGLKGLGPNSSLGIWRRQQSKGHLDSYLPLKTEIFPSWNTVRLWRNNSDPMGMKFHSWKCHFPTSQNLLLVCSEACHAPKDSGASTTERTEAEPACIAGQTLLSLPYCTCSVGPQQQAWHHPSYLEEAVPTASSAWAPPMCQTWKEAWSFPHPLKPPVIAISV